MKHPKIYCVTSTASIGCTFLDWSILYLSGQSKIFSVDSLKWHDIVSNPLQQRSPTENAHGHLKNHRSGRQRNQDTLQIINRTDCQDLISLYPIPLYYDDCCRDLGLDLPDLTDVSTMNMILSYQKQDYINMLDWMARDQKIPVIYLAFDPSVRGYKWSRRSMDRLMMSPKKPTSVAELDREHQDVFFYQSQRHWEALGLTAIWDVRERMALDIRPFDGHWSDDLLLAHEYLWINCQDLWFDTERTVIEIMSGLGLGVVSNRLEHWRPIAKSWQQIQNRNLRFPRLLPKIIGSIVHGHKHDISQLTFDQEVIIQHCLIYHHGLNLKTWNLVKFPDCTSQLHTLLEPNLHPLL